MAMSAFDLREPALRDCHRTGERSVKIASPASPQPRPLRRGGRAPAGAGRTVPRVLPGSAPRMARAEPPRGAAAAPPPGGPVTAPGGGGERQEQGLLLLLYDDPHSEYCAKVKIALRAKGLQWRPLPAKPCGSGGGGGGAGSPEEFARRAPLSKIPVLVVQGLQAGASAAAASGQPRGQQRGGGDAGLQEAAAEGRPEPQCDEVVLCESEVINEFLEDMWPQPSLLPADPVLRAQARLVSRFHDLYLEPALRQLYPLASPEAYDSASAAAAAAALRARLGQLEALLPAAGPAGGGRRYAVGSSLSLADCGFPAALHWAELLLPALGQGELDYGAWPRVAAWRAGLLADPHVVAVLEELGPAAREWLEGKRRRAAAGASTASTDTPA